MKIHLDRIPNEGIHILETRPAEWWNNFADLLDEGSASFAEPVRLDIKVQRVGSQVRVEGAIRATIKTSCSRCLEDMVAEVVAPVDVFMVPEQRGAVLPDDEDVGFETYTGEEFDLTEHLKGQLALHFPVRFLCKPDCRGLCPRCGANLNLEKCSCAEKSFDTRWSALKNLKFN